MKYSYGAFKDGVLIERNNVLFNSNNEELATVDVPQIFRNSFRGIDSSRVRSFYLSETLDVYYKDISIDEEAYILNVDSEVLPKELDKESFGKLSQGLASKYRKEVRRGTSYVKVPADSFEKIIETSETIDSYYNQKLPSGVLVLISGLKREFTVSNFNHFIRGKIALLQKGAEAVMSTNYRYEYLEEPWDGSFKKVYEKKRNGQRYADGRGHMVKDYRAIDEVPVVDVKSNSYPYSSTPVFDSLEGLDLVIIKIAEKIINPGFRKASKNG